MDILWNKRSISLVIFIIPSILNNRCPRWSTNYFFTQTCPICGDMHRCPMYNISIYRNACSLCIFYIKNIINYTYTAYILIITCKSDTASILYQTFPDNIINKLARHLITL